MTVDIVIHGAGIAGLWAFRRLKALGYDVLLLEKNAIGGGQTVASQGILHSGLKYALAGKVNELARQISAMPERWLACIEKRGEIDLGGARVNAENQCLLIPGGFMGGLVQLVAGKALPLEDWPQGVVQAGFKGSLVPLEEPVLDIPSVVRALAEPYKDCIRMSGSSVDAGLHIYTAAEGNRIAANQNGDEVKTQTRPLLMGMLKPAPFPLWAHLVGKSDKPVASITTHEMQDGVPVWYIGGGVAERAKDDDPAKVYNEAIKAFQKYLPHIDFSGVEWASVPIDRVEGLGKSKGWMPDTPVVHETEHALYCWPTKLTFAPLLADMIVERVQKRGISPSGKTSDFSSLPAVDYALPPWDKAIWSKI